MANITGTAGNDTLNGTSTADVLLGRDGDDILNGLGGDDFLSGEAGADTTRGGAGNDFHEVDDPRDVVIELAGQGYDVVFSSLDTYTLAANVEELRLDVPALDATGNTLDNRISGNDADNVIDGGAGADYMLGGGGNDTYIVDNALDFIEEAAGSLDTVRSSVSYTLQSNVENLNLIDSAISGVGNASNNVLVGNHFANTLDGLAGNDTLDGKEGPDTLRGGAGNDLYIVDSIGDKVIENAGEGTMDAVSSYITFVLPDQVENLTLAGRRALDVDGVKGIDGFGNAKDNILIGNDLNNTLVGGAGNDVIQGGGGTDTMIGGTGDDTYYVDTSSLLDVVVENAGAGTDTVVTFIQSYALAANVENLVLNGDRFFGDTDGEFHGHATTGTGNELANVISGNERHNMLSGAGGDDTLEGSLGGDQLDGGTGFDYALYDTDSVSASLANAKLNVGEAVGDTYISIEGIIGSLFKDNLSGDAGANRLVGRDGDDYLSGAGGNDILEGGVGADHLEGGTGADTLNGGSGFDFARYDNGGAVIADLSTPGLNSGDAAGDTYVSIEALFGSRFADSLFGNNIDNSLVGGDGQDILNGREGNDYLKGGTGNDMLDGGSGSDKLNGDTGADILTGGADNDNLYFVRGQANGDAITDFTGNGALAGDELIFQGYGTAAQGARLIQLDVTHWQIDSADGLVHEILAFTNAAAIHATDYAFV